MNEMIDQLVQSVLQKKSLQECSVAELQQLANQYPYSGPIQLILAARLKSEDAAGYKEQFQHTSLFFNNPLWLDNILNETNKTAIVTEPQKQEVTTREITEEPTETIIEQPQEPEIKIPSLTIKPFDPNESTLIFEPYHTVDYFASQGIKYKAEERPKDKFGQQLKSFTEWLKTLKQTPVSDIPKSEEQPVEGKVEQLAEHSLDDREVVTEAMAEVWEKQGNREKATEIYNKLSLLNPPKSSYFAAKIEQLKKLT